MLASSTLALTALSALRRLRGSDDDRRIAPRDAAPARNLAPGEVDVGAMLHDVVNGLRSVAARSMVRLDHAAPNDLVIRGDEGALRGIVTALAEAAIGFAPCGRVLVTALHHGGRLQFAAVDDNGALSNADREAVMAELSQRVAMRGGTFEMKVREGEGGTILVRLLAPLRGSVPTPARPMQAAPTETDGVTMQAPLREVVASGATW